MGNEKSLAARVSGPAAGVRNFKDEISGTFADAGWQIVGYAAYAQYPQRYGKVDRIFMRGVPYIDVFGKDRYSEYGYVLKKDGAELRGRIEAEALPSGDEGRSAVDGTIRNAKYRYPESRIVLVFDVEDEDLLEYARGRAGEPEFAEGGKNVSVLSPDELEAWFFENLA